MTRTAGWAVAAAACLTALGCPLFFRSHGKEQPGSSPIPGIEARRIISDAWQQLYEGTAEGRHAAIDRANEVIARSEMPRFAWEASLIKARAQQAAGDPESLKAAAKTAE
ncbi:MAG: hypothetical protein WC485_12670, partial [Opitutaceae bacterium]